jgi:hypothetical protein
LQQMVAGRDDARLARNAGGTSRKFRRLDVLALLQLKR